MVLILKGKKWGHINSISEENMDKAIPREKALVIYCTGTGFGRFEGFDSFYKEGEDTYKTFTEKLVKAGLLETVD